MSFLCFLSVNLPLKEAGGILGNILNQSKLISMQAQAPWKLTLCPQSVIMQKSYFNMKDLIVLSSFSCLKILKVVQVLITVKVVMKSFYCAKANSIDFNLCRKTLLTLISFIYTNLTWWELILRTSEVRSDRAVGHVAASPRNCIATCL